RTPPTRTSTHPLPRRDRSRRPHHPPRRHRATAPPTTQRPDPAPGRGPRKSRPRHPPAHGAHRSHASHRRTRHRVLPHRSRPPTHTAATPATVAPLPAYYHADLDPARTLPTALIPPPGEV